jgi:hypothetical protein
MDEPGGDDAGVVGDASFVLTTDRIDRVHVTE